MTAAGLPVRFWFVQKAFQHTEPLQTVNDSSTGPRSAASRARRFISSIACLETVIKIVDIVGLRSGEANDVTGGVVGQLR